MDSTRANEMALAREEIRRAEDALAPILRPEVKLRLAETIMVMGRPKFEEGEVVMARLGTCDSFSVEIVVREISDSAERRVAIVTYADLVDAEVVTDG